MSLRARLLIGLAVVAVVLVGAALVITRTTETYLVDRVDAQLAAGAANPGFDPRPRPGEARTPRLSSVYVAEVDVDGTLLVGDQPTLVQAVPAFSDDLVKRIADGTQASGRPFTVGTDPPSDHRFRVLPVRRPQGDTLLLALPLDDVDASVSRLVGVEVGATALILGILGVVAFWVLRLGVRPIKRMTDTATAIAAGDLSHRVPEEAAGTEAGALGAALNRMLGHIEGAMAEREASQERLRRFVGDASHELRTPVTTIRGYAELYRSGGLQDPDELRQAMRRTEQEAIRMGALVDDLLLLARLDQGRPLDRNPVDLAGLASDAARDAHAVQPERPVDADVEPGVTVVGDEGRLRQVFANVVGNALVHTPPGTPVHVSVRRVDGHATVEVRDEGPGMAPDVAAHAFERFYRADPSRSRHQGGSGLGLAIVQAIVDAHGGQVQLHSEAGRGTVVRIDLPVLPST